MTGYWFTHFYEEIQLLFFLDKSSVWMTLYLILHVYSRCIRTHLRPALFSIVMGRTIPICSYSCSKDFSGVLFLQCTKARANMNTQSRNRKPRDCTYCLQMFECIVAPKPDRLFFTMLVFCSEMRLRREPRRVLIPLLLHVVSLNGRSWRFIIPVFKGRWLITWFVALVH